MRLQIVDPADYPGWDALLLRSNDHSFFHSSKWAAVLIGSYQYKPAYFVSLEDDKLAFLMPLMEVASPLTGKRGVSLPFSDQCASYLPHEKSFAEAVHGAIDHGRKAGWRYIEWRDSRYFTKDVPTSEAYFTHDVDLAKSEQDLFSSLRGSHRRCIKKAIREGLSISVSQSMNSVKSFFRLNCLTRKRHGLPPQPFVFFKNVFDHIISKDSGILVTAFHSEKAVAAAVFFHFGDRVIFKFGASDMAFQHLRANNLVMWEALKWYRERGFKTLNLGRTEAENRGLLQHKRGWGASESQLNYIRYDIKREAYLQKTLKKSGFPERLFCRTPVGILRLVSHVFYRHVG
jgi:hypothetical protein